MSRRDTIVAYAEERLKDYQQLALDIHAHPEVSNYEFFACEHLSTMLRKEGFDVKTDVAGHRTGFDARYVSGKPGPVIVFLAEFDALAGLGHGCGHNLFGATSSLAAACLKQVIDQVGGEVRVYGTPGEEGGENGSAKGSFVREGFLKDVDAALCVHPGAGVHTLTTKTLGCAPVDIEFWGKPAHAANCPEDGINALNALLMTYRGIDALRQHCTDDVRIHGIIVNGGTAPNIVPEYAKGKFYLRAATAPMMKKIYEQVEHIVEGAALMTGAKERMQPYQNIVENTVVTPSFDAVYQKHLEEFGEHVRPIEPRDEMGSSDVGNISQVVPTIQPHITISEQVVPAHSEEFKAAAKSPLGLASIGLGAKVMALTALDLLEDPELLAKIKKEHAEAVKAQ